MSNTEYATDVVLREMAQITGVRQNSFGGIRPTPTPPTPQPEVPEVPEEPDIIPPIVRHDPHYQALYDVYLDGELLISDQDSWGITSFFQDNQHYKIAHNVLGGGSGSTAEPMYAITSNVDYELTRKLDFIYKSGVQPNTTYTQNPTATKNGNSMTVKLGPGEKPISYALSFRTKYHNGNPAPAFTTTATVEVEGQTYTGTIIYDPNKEYSSDLDGTLVSQLLNNHNLGLTMPTLYVSEYDQDTGTTYQNPLSFEVYNLNSDRMLDPVKITFEDKTLMQKCYGFDSEYFNTLEADDLNSTYTFNLGKY